MKNLIFVDVEATGPCPGYKGAVMTEFGAVDFNTRHTFHGRLYESRPSVENPALFVLTGVHFDDAYVFEQFDVWIQDHTKGRAIMVSDNPAFDFQWINYGFWHSIGRNPFGHSARRISDFYAGLTGDFGNSQKWKSLRITTHDHHPVHDAMGNVEAFERILKGER